MDLVLFFFDQFRVPIIGLTLLGLFLWLRVFVRPIRRVMPPSQKVVSPDAENPVQPVQDKDIAQ